MKREGWEVCGFCHEPLDGAGDSGMVMNMASHHECAFRAIIGGLNHLKGNCSCCGGTEPPDPPGLTPREAARVAVEFWREREAALRKAARDACQAVGVPWYNPTTWERNDPQ